MAIDQDKLKQDVIRGYRSAKKYANPIWYKRITNFNLLIGKIKRKKFKSDANFHVPYSQTLLENVFPLLVARLPEPKIAPADTDIGGKAAEAMERLTKYTFDVNQYDKLFLMVTKESMQMDTGWAKVSWNYANKETDHPKIELCDTFHVIAHPRKKHIDDRWPIYHYSEMTRQEMKERGWNETTIDALAPSKLLDEDFRRMRLQSLGYTSNVADNDPEVYPVVEFWGKYKLDGDDTDEEEMAYVVMANEEELLNEKPLPGRKAFQSPYDHSYLPYVPLPYNPQPHMIYGESFIEPIASQQLELNALENMKADNYGLRNNPPFLVDRDSSVDMDSLQFVTGAPWLVSNINNDIKFLEIPDLAPSIDNQQEMIRKVMQARTGANDVLLVQNDIAIQGGDSATGASIANENTKLRFRPQAIQIDFFNKRIGELVVALFQQPDLFDRPKAISIADEDGNYLEQEIKPNDVMNVDLNYIVSSASSLAESDQDKLTKAINIKTLYAEDPNKNQDELDKPVFEAAGYDWNKVNLNKEAYIAQLTGKLKQLVTVTRMPNFANQPDSVKAAILTQIDTIKQLLQGSSSDTPPPAAPAMAGAQPGQPAAPQMGPPGPLPMMPAPPMGPAAANPAINLNAPQ